MSTVTIVGTSGRAFAVTVDGAAAHTLAQQYAAAVAGLRSRGGVTTVDMSPDEGGQSAIPGSDVQGMISVGGVYTPTGDVSRIAVGSYYPGEDPQDTLNAAVSIDLAKDTAKHIDIIGGDFAGINVKVGQGQNGSFVGGVGNNLFDGRGNNGDWAVATGSGNDTIWGTDGKNTINAGAGLNVINLGKGENDVVLGGADSVLGSGGRDRVTIAEEAGRSFVDLRQDKNAVVVDRSTIGWNNIQVGDGSRVVAGINDTISAAGDLYVQDGRNSTISVDGALNFVGGTGDTKITAGKATIFGGSGSNVNYDGVMKGAQSLTFGARGSTLHDDQRVQGSSLFVGNQPVDGQASRNILLDGSKSHGSLVAWVGANQTVIGGAASDTLTGMMGNSTLTGGSGAANVFQFIKGNVGHYTITDFRAAAGNIVGLNGYHMSKHDLENVVSHATVAGGNSTIQLSDKTQITFIGDTHLKASDFGLWGQ